MTTTTAVFNTLPVKVKRAATGEYVLQAFARATNHDVAWMAQGIAWADASCRIDGTLALALRKLTAWELAKLILVMLKDGITMNDVPRWLVANRQLVLG
jgi:hypothetical protein